MTADSGGRLVPMLRPDDAVVHLTLQAALSGGHRLQWLVDLQQALGWCGRPGQELAETARRAGPLLVLRPTAQRAAQHVDPGLFP